MSVPEFYSAQFRWPHTEPNEVIVTGEFDAWSGSNHLSRTANGWEGVVQVPWGRKLAYKYIVDGRWTTTDDQPTELDMIGNLNNVLNIPSRPASPKAPTLSTPEPPSKPAGQVNGILATVKDTAVAMVEATAPGTTDTPASTPPVAAAEPQVAAVPEPAEPTPQVAEPEKPTNGSTVAAQPEEEKPSDVTPPPAPEAAQTSEKDIAAEAVLPPAAQDAPKAPDVPVPVLPLAATDEPPLAKGGVREPLETVVVEGSATVETVTPVPATAVEPSTHTPAAPPETKASAPESTDAAPAPAAAAQSEPEPSTHTPAPPVETEKPSATNGAEEPSSTAAEPVKPATNGTKDLAHSPEPISVTLPPAKPTTGTISSTSTQNSPLKEKRHAFPSFGRHRRQSSSTASVSTAGPDEHGTIPSSPANRRGPQKEKRRTSIFGKIKEIFSDDHHKAKK